MQLGTTRSGTGWTTNQRPNAVSGVDGTGDPDGPIGWLNLAGFSDPAPGTFGNLGRNTERGPRFVQLDMSLLKRTTLHGNQKLEFRIEVFNILNKPIWAAMPARVFLTPASFGNVQNTLRPHRVVRHGASDPARRALRVLNETHCSCRWRLRRSTLGSRVRFGC